MSPVTQRTIAEKLVRRRDLISRLTSETSLRTFRVRRTVGPLLTSSELKNDIITALGTGYLRALAIRFASEQNLTPEWWMTQRRKYAGHGSDRRMDVAIIRSEFPEFDDYVVDVADDEVISAAKIDYRDSIASVGTDYHQLEMQRRNVGGTGDVRMLRRSRDRDRFSAVAVHDFPLTVMLDAEDGEIDFVDPAAQDRVENATLHRLLESEDHPLGPVVTQVATIAIREYGPSGLFWLVERLFLPGKYADVLRTLTGTEADLGAREFERLRRDLARKLPEIHERMMPILRADKAMAELVEMIDEARALPVQVPRAPVSRPLREVVSRERARCAQRHQPTLMAKLADTPHLLQYFTTLPEQEQMGVVYEYLRNTEEHHWPRFIGWLTRNQNAAA